MLTKLGLKYQIDFKELKDTIEDNILEVLHQDPLKEGLTPTYVNTKKFNKRTSKMGLREGWTRVTFILKEEHVEKLKSLAYWERSTIKELVDEALTMYFDNTNKSLMKRDM